jgi:hypothetical protein
MATGICGGGTVLAASGQTPRSIKAALLRAR